MKLWNQLKESAKQWSDHGAFRLSAALSYYSIFSVGPLLILATGVAGLVVGAEAARGELVAQFSSLMGEEGGRFIEAAIANTYAQSNGFIATVVGAGALLIGATGAFAELKSALNLIWGVRPQDPSGVLEFIKARLLSLGLVVVIGFLLMVSLLASAWIAALGKYFAGTLPFSPVFLRIGETLLSLGFITVLFAMIFKILPEARVRWKDVWIGAILTSILFTAGKYLIGLYLGQSSLSSSFGASASLALIMVWVYYSSLILFFGAEFTQVHSRALGVKRARGRARHLRAV